MSLALLPRTERAPRWHQAHGWMPPPMGCCCCCFVVDFAHGGTVAPNRGASAYGGRGTLPKVKSLGLMYNSGQGQNPNGDRRSHH
ncbi:hypothetical protein HIM_04897 [Hirsutella minnesotensis 3608]|uniref:Uncharacterized protein n=1 Tax=Hirsutella minnesotensis 3608 TaxID=1043627 RepID=A0A0F7ZPM1_9HYPO|nr:hypothetical protein HIM_04897 [Hirsutella minnesotensis 3608]